MTALDTEVLIVGSGPTGLTLALWLGRLGVRVRIIDRRPAPGQTSRALAVQARTLEFHRQIGIVDDVLAAGIRLNALTVRTPVGIGASLKLAEFGRGLSRYAYAFALPQDIHERILIEHLERSGISVERETELVSFEDDGSLVTAKLRKGDSIEFVRAAYLAGCDGAHSAVRHGLNIEFPGGTYDQSFYVADVEGDSDIGPNDMQAWPGLYGFALVMPVRQTGTLRLIGVVPKKHETNPEITFETIRKEVERDSRVKVRKVKWFSTYRVHHRVARRFRVGRVFIAGDAGHIHSPAGGQGMNTGMGDAVNLAWKLAAVLQGRADERLLDSYEPERIAFAHLLIKSTDQAFKIMTNQMRVVGFWRRYVMPKLISFALNTRRGSRFFFRMISQIGINYRQSSISSGSAAEVHAGDRLPYVADGQWDNFAPLGSLDWQVHVHGQANPAFRAAVERKGFALQVFPWTPAAAKAGLVQDCAYLTRPDGYVGLVDSTQSPAAFEAYVNKLGLRPRGHEKRLAANAPRRGDAAAPAHAFDRAARLREQQNHDTLTRADT
jgi:2-polyprenyl-6-methoxyphenol hydroxylase-like FAD-dependent oxidoreductase